MAEDLNPRDGIRLTHFIVVQDVERSRAFYSDVLGGETVREGEPSIVQLANSWIIINVGGGPTVDKPDVILETPPDPTRASSFLNIRVADIEAVYEDWRSRGAEFITPPKDLGRETRCVRPRSQGWATVSRCPVSIRHRTASAINRLATVVVALAVGHLH